MIQTDKKEIWKLTALFICTYMVSYITRINYGAVLLAMEEATSFSNAALSMAVTGSFITYGAGQVVSGVIGDKVSPKKLIFFGFILTILMNLCITLCPNPIYMTAVWCVNGFAQAFMWPPLVRLMTVLFDEKMYKKVTVRVSWGSCMGTVAVYVLSPLLITLWNWKSVFIFSAVCGIVMAIFWNKVCPEVGRVTVVKEKKEGGSQRELFAPMMLVIMLAIVAQGALRDSVTTWMPTYLSNTYGMDSAKSILSGAILPFFSILCFQLAGILHDKKFKNPLTCAAVIFAVGLISAGLLLLVSGLYAGVSIALFALLIGAMHGVNLMLISMIPPFFAKYGNVSTASGVLNACAYVGSAVSTYGVALISERAGWNTTLYIWMMVAALGTACCILCIRPWKRKHG